MSPLAGACSPRRASPLAFGLAAALALAGCAPPAMVVEPGAPPARVRFVPPSGSEGPVTVTARPTGMRPFHCVAPCSMLLPAGTQILEFDAEGRGGPAMVNVASGDALGHLQLENRGAARGGGIASLLGGGVASIGIALYPLNMWASIATSAVGVAVGLPGFIVWLAAGSNGVRFEPAPAGTFGDRASLAPGRPDPSRATSDMAPPLTPARWSF